MTRDFNNSQKTFIYSRQKGCCGNCGANLSDEVDIEYHHVLNHKDGGASIVENGVMLCKACHLHCHDYDFSKPVLIYRDEFKYANWQENSYYKSRKKGREVEFTKETLNRFDKQYRGEVMQIDSYENHVQMLESFNRNIVALKRHIQEIREQYKRQIDVAESAGFVQNYTDTLKTKYQVFSTKIDEINALIERQDAKLKQQKEIMGNLISMARSN